MINNHGGSMRRMEKCELGTEDGGDPSEQREEKDKGDSQHMLGHNSGFRASKGVRTIPFDSFR